MKRKLALFCAITILFTQAMFVSPISAETNSSDADISLLSEYGELVMLQDFEQGSDSTLGYVNTDYITGASWIYSPNANGMVGGVVENPDETIGGSVLNATHLEGQQHAYYQFKFNGSKMYDGKYYTLFDYYSEANKSSFGCGWFGWGGMRNSFAHTNSGEWETISYPAELTATTDYSVNQYGDATFKYGNLTNVVNGTEEAPDPQVPSFGFHYDHNGEGDTYTEPTYIDNVRVYYFPENSYMLTDEKGNPTELVKFDETAATVTLPAKDGVGAWTLDGKNFYPAGYSLPTSELLGKYLTLKPFDLSVYDDTKGELLVYYDWDIADAGINTPTYINKVYFDSIANSYFLYPNVDTTKTGVYETDDSGNKALKQYTKTDSSYGFIRTDTIMKEGLSFPASTYNVDFKFYSFKDGFDYTFAESHTTGGKVWFNNGGGSVSYTFPTDADYNKWIPISVTTTLSVAQTNLKSWGLTMNPASEAYDTATYYDDVAIYFFPSTKIHFKASEESSVVKAKTADENGQIVVPTASELGIEIDGRVTEWKAADGTTLTVGETVNTAAFAAKTYYPVVVSTNATFTYGDAQATVNLGNADTFTLPTAKEVNADWTGDFYGWLYDGKLYEAGESINVDDFIGKTLVAIRSTLSIPPEKVSEYGKLVAYQDFEQGDRDDAAYVDTNYMDGISWYVNFSNTTKCEIAKNPDEVVGGKVFDATMLEGKTTGYYGLKFNGNKMYDGKYQVIFDYYSEASQSSFGLGWYDFSYRTYPTVKSGGVWQRVAYPQEAIVTTDKSTNQYGTTTLTYNGSRVIGEGTEDAPNPQLPSFAFHYNHNGEGDAATDATYIDNVMVYYFPENSYMLADAKGQLQELVEFDETKETVTLPMIEGVSAWTLDGEYLCEAGESIKTSQLLGKYATLRPLTVSTYDEELGNLVFYADFENLETGAYNNAYIPVSYADGTYTDGFTDFTFRTFSDSINSIIDVNGNNVFELRTNTTSGKTGNCYPQIQLYGGNSALNLQKEGIYTIVADATVLENTASDLSLRPTSDNGTVQVSGVSGINGNFETLRAQIEISAATTRTALTNCLIFFGGKYEEDKYVLLDNIAMYAKTNKYHLNIDEDTKVDGFFSPGENIEMPEANTFADSIPEGYELAYYDINGEKYYPGDYYQTSVNDKELNITAVINKIVYYACFNLGTINGTLAEIPVNLGGSITLPSVDDESFGGWKLYGTDEIISAGSTFTLDSDSIVDEYDRFIFEAVTAGKEMPKLKSIYELSDGMFTDATEEELKYIEAAFGVGAIPSAETFDRDTSVTIGDLIGYAVRLYNKANGISVDYAYEDALTEYAALNGICGIYADYDATATFADLADILANVLPDGYYRDTYNNVKTDLAGINENAKKLINVGIINKDVTINNTITYKDVVYAMARTIDKSLRIYNKTKTLYILGDSLCAGVGGNPGWVDKIVNFASDRINVVNYAIGGINTGSYLATYTSTATTNYKKYLTEVKPGDYVMIALGTNDASLWSGTVENQYMSYEQSLANYKKLAEDAYLFIWRTAILRSPCRLESYRRKWKLYTISP